MRDYNYRVIFVLLMAVVMISACQPTASGNNQTLPTLAVLPSLTPSEEPTATEMPSATVEATDTAVPSPTRTPPPTSTHAPTNTPTPPDPTVVAAASATVGMQEAPSFATLTPVPAGVNAPVMTTPQVLADVVITEVQFQEELNAQIRAFESIQDARIDFTETGINVELTALGGQAFITGNVFLSMEMSSSFLAITPVDIAVNAPEPPAAFVETVNGDFLNAILATLDTVLTQRLGADHDLQQVILTSTQIEIHLLVPQR